MIATCIWSYTPHTYYSPSVWNLARQSLSHLLFFKEDLLNQAESLLNYIGKKKKKKSKTIGTTLL